MKQRLPPGLPDLITGSTNVLSHSVFGNNFCLDFKSLVQPVHCPNDDLMADAERVLCYLLNHPDIGLAYNAEKVRKQVPMAAQARPPASISPLARAPLAGGDRAPFCARSISRPSPLKLKLHVCSAMPTPWNPTDLLHWHAPTHTNTHKHPSWGWYQP